MPTWNDKNRSKLLLAIIELLVPPGTSKKLPPWNEVAERMGAGFTHEAVRQQYRKLRKEGLPSSDSVPNTPQQNRPNGPVGIKKTPAGRSRGKRLFTEHLRSEEGDEEDNGSKRIKTEDEQSELGSQMVLGIESVDEDGIVDLDNNDLHKQTAGEGSPLSIKST